MNLNGHHGSTWLKDEVEEFQDYINNINSDESKAERKRKQREEGHKSLVDRAREIIKGKNARRSLEALNSTNNSTQTLNLLAESVKKRESRDQVMRDHTKARLERQSKRSQNRDEVKNAKKFVPKPIE